MYTFAQDLKTTVELAFEWLCQLPDTVVHYKRQPAKWSPKEIIGHLIDSAANNHRRFVLVTHQNDLAFI